jgi:hypothetical protein
MYGFYDRKRKKRHKITLTLPTTKRDPLKTKRATFANYIHQKDAAIAGYVVFDSLLAEIPTIYTVHDNFISNAFHAWKLPACYISAFINAMNDRIWLQNTQQLDSLFS